MHAYFNVYKRAQEGWNNFLLRRNAVKRLNSLQWATEEQLEQLNDVCCICYEVLDRAKVTKCNHFFHSLCLRKWLYVQDKCPMCHADILPQDWLLPVLQRMAAVGWIITDIINHFMIYILFIRLQSVTNFMEPLMRNYFKMKCKLKCSFPYYAPLPSLKTIQSQNTECILSLLVGKGGGVNYGSKR